MNNGGFEQGLTGWTVTGWQLNGQNPIHGTKDLQCITTGYDGATILEATSPAVTLPAGTHHAKFRYRAGQGGPNQTLANPLQILIDPGDGNFVPLDTIPDLGDHTIRGASFAFTAVGGPAHIKCKVDLQVTGGFDPTWYVDTFSFQAA